MQLQHDLVFAQFPNNTLWQAHLGFVNLNSGRGNGLGDIPGADGAKQLSFFARGGLD